MTSATRTAYLLASTGTRTTHAIVAGAARPGEFATAACGTYAEAGRTNLDGFTAAELEASPTFCKRCAKAIIAAWHQDELDGYTVTSTRNAERAALVARTAERNEAAREAHTADKLGAMFEVVAELSVDVDGFDAWQAANGMPATGIVAGIETIADYALAVEYAAHVHAGDGRLF